MRMSEIDCERMVSAAVSQLLLKHIAYRIAQNAEQYREIDVHSSTFHRIMLMVFTSIVVINNIFFIYQSV